MHGSCQCGAVQWTLAAEPAKAIECNCSRCSRTAPLFDFFPAEAFVLERGEDDLTQYNFNRGVVDRLFCRVCGVESFFRMTRPDGAKMVGINLRCIEGFDAAAIPRVQHDGASR